MAELESGSLLAPALAAGNRRIRCPSEHESPEALPDTFSLDSIPDIPDTPFFFFFDDLESDQSLDRQQPGRLTNSALLALLACSAPSVFSSRRVVGSRRNATPTEWYETFRRVPEEKGPKSLVAFVPDVTAWTVTAARVPQCTFAVLVGRKCTCVYQATRVPLAISCLPFLLGP